MTTYEMIQSVVGLGMLTTAVVGVGVGLRQLVAIAKSARQSARANQNSNFLAVITLEGAIADARYRYTQSMAYLGKLGPTPDLNAVEFANAVKEAAEEQYLNTMDRLCACIIRGQVNEEVYRRDYRNWITEVVKGFADEFGPDTRHHNILTVHEAWRDDKSAIDRTIMPPE